MAVVQGIKEKVHLPIYDSVKVKPEEQLRDTESFSTLKFFVNVQGKTKLETNLQAAALLPHYNTFEARAMRVVISDLPPQFPDKPTVEDEQDVTGTDNLTTPATPRDEIQLVYDISATAPNPLPNGITAGSWPAGFATPAGNIKAVHAEVEFGLDRVMELLQEAQESPDKEVEVSLDDDGVTLLAGDTEIDTETTNGKKVLDFGDPLLFTVTDLIGLIEDLEDKKKVPPKMQYKPRNGSGSLVGRFIYNTVTTFFVGEKEMIRMPTWFFPGGAGPYSEAGTFATHGEPNPTATFRFAEPIFIDKQQNFRVEIEIPDSDVLKELHRIYGPLFIWVVLDGYMTRDVQ